ALVFGFFLVGRMAGGMLDQDSMFACFFLCEMKMFPGSKRGFARIHPTFRQVPPSSLSFSISAVLSPSWPARIAAMYPPGPEPMITTSNLSITFRHSERSRGIPLRKLKVAPRDLSTSLGYARDDRISGSKIDRQGFRIFDCFLHFDEKCDGFFAIDKAVIVAEGEIHHWPNYHRTIHRDRALHNFMHPQDSALRWI